jgi:hypothetical protein
MDIKHIGHRNRMTSLNLKNVYAIQPYFVGSKHGKSLAVVIPAKVAKKYNLGPSTIFSLKTDDVTQTITLQNVQEFNPHE